MAFIYHVTTKQEWEAAKQKGYYTAPSLETEGFIHCSEAQQVDGVLQRYYRGKKELFKLTIDAEKLDSELKYELAPSINENFPHVYGPINLDAVVEIEEINER
jgi:uncharacterized protein (DUF952 family)